MKENNYFVGIITMHKVLNYGSALQAFALQHILNTWNIKNEIIDYIFPRKSKKTCKDLFLYRYLWYDERISMKRKELRGCLNRN